MKQLSSLLISLRPAQWVKNLAVFVAIFFGGNLFNESKLIAALFSFVAFCLIASSTYLINDLVDAKVDKIHYAKKNRPIAAGKLSIQTAFTAAATLALLALFLGSFVSKGVLVAIGLYLLTQIAYNFYLKRVLLLELLVIAFGFMLRVFAGSFATQTSLSSWLILTVMMISLFLAIGKRRSEVTLLGETAAQHRPTLSGYPLTLLDGLVFLSATASLLTYSLFTFNTSRPTVTNFLAQYLPQTLVNAKWLMVTIPIVVYGIFRYLYLIFEKKEGDSPEKILLNDKAILFTLLLWLAISGLVIYLLPAA
ncbi:MAG: decaprenyl-phosphate phosphoribosyltransferase [bacterium]|nr:decaprenyl-phosphate phosphoribosyltransferase [bacterium]